MTKEEKQILFKDLCMRLPYGVMCMLSVKGADVSITEKLDFGGLEHFMFGTMDVKPYLRPMSSMTEEEREYLEELSKFRALPHIVRDKVDFYLERHLDYRGLIPKGLALEAPEGMYKTE